LAATMLPCEVYGMRCSWGMTFCWLLGTIGAPV
jgi:predicted membrane channel-forming protein YqfA (hemolysin III family)